MLMSDLSELKVILEIDPDDTQEDLKLMFFIEWATRWIEELLNRTGSFSYAERTEIYKGTGTQKLCLRSRPVYTTPTIQVWQDGGANFGSTSGAWASNTELTYGTDFCLDLKTDGATSRSGILWRINNTWPKPTVRQVGYLTPFVGDDLGSIKVTYTGGYTLDTLPAQFRMAMNILVAKMRHLFPLGMELGSESYEERGISILANSKTYLLKSVMDLILPYRSWRF